LFGFAAEYAEKVLLRELLPEDEQPGFNRKKNWTTILTAPKNQKLLLCLQDCVPANKKKPQQLAQR
jgi:hypothetical protein